MVSIFPIGLNDNCTNLMKSEYFIKGAQEAGLLGGLVKTGKYRPGDEEKCETKPNFVFDNLLDMAKLITDQN